jgi:predicted alpha/beta hydrolase
MGKTSTLWDSQREALAAGYDAVVADYRGSGSVSETTERVLVSMCDWASR